MPEMITKLEPQQIFIFGSNLAGIHAGGAARQAKEQFGAIEGQGEGLQGQSYAFPTLDKHFGKLTVRELEVSVKNLYREANDNPDKEFLLTKVGEGIAGYSPEYMKTLFGELPKNIKRV